MSRCALWGYPIVAGDGVCSFRFDRDDHTWATSNRIMCDFLHHGIVAPAPRREADDPGLFDEEREDALDAALIPSRRRADVEQAAR